MKMIRALNLSLAFLILTCESMGFAHCESEWRKWQEWERAAERCARVSQVVMTVGMGCGGAWGMLGAIPAAPAMRYSELAEKAKAGYHQCVQDWHRSQQEEARAAYDARNARLREERIQREEELQRHMDQHPTDAELED